MLCRLCKKKIEHGEEVKTKSGFICPSCLNMLPDSVKMNVRSFTARQLIQLSTIIHPASSKTWIDCGTFSIGRNCIVLKGIEYRLEDLRSVRLNFHPKEVGRHPNTSIGIITVVIETLKPHFMIEEPFFPRDVTVGYSISGKSIIYHYSYEIGQLFAKIQECIDDQVYDMTDYYEKYRQAVMNAKKYKEMKEQERKRAEEMARQKKETEKKRKEEERKKAEQERKKREEEKQKSGHGSSSNSGRGDTHRKVSPFDEAKSLFGVQMPYTTEQIRSVRNKLIKKHHPDNNGGSEEMCKKINESYALLLKFVAD